MPLVWKILKLNPLLLILVLAVISTTVTAATVTANTGENLITTRTFKESGEYTSNPFMGPVARYSNKNPNYEGTIVVGGFTWAEIEKNKGEYDFTLAEKNNNYHYWINEKNRQFMHGLVMDSPSVSKKAGYDQIDIPMWLYEELKAEAVQTYSELLKHARATGDQSKISEYETALDKILNDQKVIDTFNRNMYLADKIPGPGERETGVANIPGVGTFYMWKMNLPDGKVEYQGGFSPNYSSPLLIEYHDRLMQAIARQYDNDNTFIIIMGSLGHWGEMHTTYIRGENDVGRYPSIAVASQYEQAYARYFKNTIVSSRYPRQVALDNNFGLHNHAFGHPQHTYDWFVDWYTSGYRCYFTNEHHPAMPDFWKTAPSGAAFLYTGDYRYITDKYIEDTLQQAKDTHLTWIYELRYNLSPEAEHNMNRLLSKIGYRFAITEASYNSSVPAGNIIELTTKWRNGGTAPFYYDWPIVVQLHGNEGVVAEKTINESVRNIFPGSSKTYRTTMEVPKTLEPGQYQLWTGIINPKTQQAGIQLTLENIQEHEGMVLIGEVDVTAGQIADRLGDINGDGQVDVIDVIMAVKYCLGLIDLSDEQVAKADVNGDGIVDVRDVTLIMLYSLGLITEFPTE